ncbi:hypothetical protein TNIN_427951 [Trichonephila inaurata madagascariensis]|uniref:Uncharacterized protein n=1 Tax=Trichonephila inaurata madagascariensis TaxID=2747483 RepID=A0A8X6WU01_9ARAC|nr:hypothetical protein TNIN_427951 [Trichonephila inaurata madagascariensis]
MDFIKRDGTIKIRRSSRERENRKSGKRVRFKLRTHDNFSRDRKVRGEAQPLDFKVVDPNWMEKRREYFRKLDTLTPANCIDKLNSNSPNTLHRAFQKAGSSSDINTLGSK